MVKPSQDQPIYEFGKFRLDSNQRLVKGEGQALPLTPKMVETLLALVERAGQVVDKDTLMERAGPRTFVEESNLTYNISVLRKVLRGNDGEQSYIETLPKRGYRFICPVKELSVSEDSQNNGEYLGTGRDKGIGGASRTTHSNCQPCLRSNLSWTRQRCELHIPLLR